MAQSCALRPLRPRAGLRPQVPSRPRALHSRCYNILAPPPPPQAFAPSPAECCGMMQRTAAAATFWWQPCRSCPQWPRRAGLRRAWCAAMRPMAGAGRTKGAEWPRASSPPTPPRTATLGSGALWSTLGSPRPGTLEWGQVACGSASEAKKKGMHVCMCGLWLCQ